MERAAKLLILLATAALLTLLSGALFAAAPRALGVSLAALTQSAAFALLALGVAALLPGRSAERLGLGPGALPARALLLLVLGTLALSHSLDVAVRLAGLDEVGALAELDASLRGARGLPLALALLGIALAPGVAEELCFRGLLQRSLTRRFARWRGGAILAIAVAAALFGLLHADPVQSPTAFVLGLYLGAIAHLAGSVRPAILCHVLNNATALLGSAFAVQAPGSPGPLLLGGLLLSLVALGWALRERRLLGLGGGLVGAGLVPAGEAVGEQVAAHQEGAEHGGPQ